MGLEDKIGTFRNVDIQISKPKTADVLQKENIQKKPKEVSSSTTKQIENKETDEKLSEVQNIVSDDSGNIKSSEKKSKDRRYKSSNKEIDENKRKIMALEFAESYSAFSGILKYTDNGFTLMGSVNKGSDKAELPNGFLNAVRDYFKGLDKEDIGFFNNKELVLYALLKLLPLPIAYTISETLANKDKGGNPVKYGNVLEQIVSDKIHEEDTVTEKDLMESLKELQSEITGISRIINQNTDMVFENLPAMLYGLTYLLADRIGVVKIPEDTNSDFQTYISYDETINLKAENLMFQGEGLKKRLDTKKREKRRSGAREF